MYMCKFATYDPLMNMRILCDDITSRACLKSLENDIIFQLPIITETPPFPTFFFSVSTF